MAPKYLKYILFFLVFLSVSVVPSLAVCWSDTTNCQAGDGNCPSQDCNAMGFSNGNFCFCNNGTSPSCNYNTACVCSSFSEQGQYCGGEIGGPDCNVTHVYECHANGTSSCDYGVRDSCVQCGAWHC
ncbi:8208_t:CDS:2 [Diversispora eburnea]|uniref:8208_t:CDS:1 n=2 Tax=Diversisporales TaxID=214509 RepID=A0A9N8YMM2_9GLOM|nr:8208_t:CDS:2 [Diversispora eburnea]CAG8585393.1 13696_t:CDS:2 [Dentiscutata erythropus]